MSVDPGQVMAKLSSQADELERLSSALNDVETRLMPLEAAHEKALTEYTVKVWQLFQDGKMKRLPSEDIRVRLAEHEMDQVMLGEYAGHQINRRRLRERISSLKEEVGAQRSLLSALKVAGEADGAGMRAVFPAWAGTR